MSKSPCFSFDGWIAGLGTTSGTRFVVGHWPRSPFDAFSDVMVEKGDGERVLLAPSERIAEFIAGTYVFDAVHVVPVDVDIAADTWRVSAGPLRLRFTTGARPLVGRLLRAVPARLARRPAWAALIDHPVRLLMPGVRTRGSAGGNRREWYGAQDLHAISSASGVLEDTDLGALAAVDPPVRFGFGSTPRAPALTRVTTTVALSRS
ncbi:hypothetical protein ACWD5F_05035 [Streptomyces sp. NPDC002499]